MSGAAAKGLGWTLFGRLWLTAANAAMMLTLALWLLDESTFGEFVTVIGAQLFLSRLVLVGVDQAIVRLFAAHRSVLTGERALAAGYRSASVLALPVAALGGGLLALYLPPIAALATAVGAIGVAWFDLGCAASLARLRYRRVGLLLAAMPSLRAAITLTVAAAASADSVWPVLVQALVTATFAAGLVASAPTRPKERATRGDLRRLWSYSVWTGMSDAAVMLALNLGIFMLQAFHDEDGAGVLGFSMQFAFGFFAAFLALYQTLLPRAARVTGVDALPGFLRSAWRSAVLLAAICAAAAVAVGLVVPPLIPHDRPELAEFAPSFWALSGFMIALVLEAPLGVTCHYLMLPRLQFVGLLVRCLVIAALSLWLVPAHGAVGAALAQAGGAVVAALTLAALVRTAIQSRRRRAACVAS